VILREIQLRELFVLFVVILTFKRTEIHLGGNAIVRREGADRCIKIDIFLCENAL